MEKKEGFTWSRYRSLQYREYTGKVTGSLGWNCGNCGSELKKGETCRSLEILEPDCIPVILDFCCGMCRSHFIRDVINARDGVGRGMEL